MPGITAARTAGSTASRCMPSASAPAARRRANQAKSSGGSHWTWIGSDGTAAFTAAAHAARCAAPRSADAGVPVVSTSCSTPSSRTAASATSASCAGVLRASVRPSFNDVPIAQNWQARAASA